MSDSIPFPPLRRGLVLLMAAATGLAAASNYYAQPLLEILAAQFHIQVRSIGVVVTAAQLAYAAGLIFLVPLGDRLERRGLIVTLFLLGALGLLISANSRSFGLLLIGTMLTGFCSVAAQILVPFAATLASPQARGRVIGTVMSGLLLGILLARVAAGLLAGIGGWHTVYWLAAVLMLLTAVLLRYGLPRQEGNRHLSYWHLIGSVLGLLREDAVLRARSILGALTFAGFSMFWTTLAFLLSGPRYGYGTTVIGLFGLIGAAGALAANRAGHWCDRGRGEQVIWAGLSILLLSWAVLAAAPDGLWQLIVGVIALDVAVQGVHIANQSVIYQHNAHARNRITAAYITCYFIGGALGSTLGTALYAQAGWNAVAIGGGALALLTLAWAAFSVWRRTWK